MATINRWMRLLFAPIDISSLVFFRIVFGVTLFVEGVRYWQHGWFAELYALPKFHFVVFGFGWIRAFHPWLTDISMPIMGITSIFIALGFLYRSSAAIFFIVFTYVHFLELTKYQNHFYLVSLLALVLVFIPAHHAFSIDALVRPRLRSQTAPAWTQWMLMMLVGIPYFYGGLMKINWDWLAGEPTRMRLAGQTSFPVIGQYLTEEWAVMFITHGGLFFDLLVVPCLLWKRTRIPAYVAALFFHLMNAAMFNIGMFPWFMILATLLFFHPSWPRRILVVIPSYRKALAEGLVPVPENRYNLKPPSQLNPRQKVAAALIVLFVAFQLLFPLRHHLYPGPHIWNEEGSLFAWNMKLRRKDGHARFILVDGDTGEKSLIRTSGQLMGMQRERMAQQPFLMQQFAKHLAELEREKGRTNFEIHVDAEVSLNGRDYQPIVDPDVDLLTAPRTVFPAKWIFPLEERHLKLP